MSVDGAGLPAQGYELRAEPGRISIRGADDAGLFYGMQTLAQLLAAHSHAGVVERGFPACNIRDWPDLPVRGVMLDISRDKVPSMATLFDLVDLLASWKLNQLQLYTEHTFAYTAHDEVWKDASPMTAGEVRELDAYCRERHVELVPNQNSFGHMERWLNHPAYLHLAEAPDGAMTPWNFFHKGPFSLCPTDSKTMAFLRGLFDELLPNFTSKLFNIGGDETFDVGQGRSKAEAERVGGPSRVYLNFLRHLHAEVRSRGLTMMFWGDIVLQHPELIAELPRDLIAMQWGYEADHPFDRDAARFAAAGVPFYVCPGTSTWNALAGRADNALGNLASAADAGRKHGAIGYLITDWGDNGHLQYLPASYLGFAAGAAFSWCRDSNQDFDAASELSRHAFDDPSGEMGLVALELGNVYRLARKAAGNSSVLFAFLVPPPNDPAPHAGVTIENLDAVDAAIDATLARLDRHRSTRSDAQLIVDEFRNAGRLMKLCTLLGRAKLRAIAADDPRIAAARDEAAIEHRRLWLARNREGGLRDSVKRITG